MNFSSKKDWWLTIIVWVPMLFFIGIGGYTLLYKEFSIGGFVLIFILMVILPIQLLWMWLTTYYVLDDSHLVIKYGPFKKVIPLNTIKSVKKTMNPWSSPALSLKRLEIMYGKYDIVLISPIDRDKFMEIISERCPQIKIKI